MSHMNKLFGQTSRRDFVKGSGLVVGGGLLAGGLPSSVSAYAAGSEEIKIALVGCGGRGTGAAAQAMSTGKGVKLVAMADAFEDRLQESLKALNVNYKDQVDVPKKRQFVGFDGYKQAIELADVILFATPPAFRPIHLRAAVEAGKHTFVEKPVAVDAVGVRHVVESSKMAEEKGLSIVAGTIYRRQSNFMEAIERIHKGELGQIVGGHEYYMTGPIWVKQRKPGMSDMEYQMRNWYYYTWLSGDHIVEQFVHNIDAYNWIMGSHPVKALATGGRIQRTGEEHGHIYDHFSVEYEYPNEVKIQASCRQFLNTKRHVINRVVCEDGVAWINPQESWFQDHKNKVTQRFEKSDAYNPFVKEHEDLFNSIREKKPINEGVQIAHSSMTAILGRESAYTGKELTWDEVYNSDLDLVPKKFEWGDMDFAQVPIPGVTELARAL